MLKKLKLKFILINMLLVAAVLLTVAAANIASVYRIERAQTERSLDRIFDMAGRTDAPPEFDGRGNMPQMGKDELPDIYAFLVLVDENGGVVRRYAVNADMDGETLSAAIAAALSGEDRGTLSKQQLLYEKRQSGEGTLIAFASSAAMNARITQTALSSALMFAVSLLPLLGIGIFLSNMAVKPAERAWQQQKQFVADASHDLKTPLTVILANNNILRAHADETVASQIKWIESTDEEAGRMRALTDKLLELARTENLKNTVTLAATDVSALCEQTALQFEPVAFEKGVAVESDVEPQITVKTDAESFSRLAYILVDNAVKYSKSGGTVKVLLKKEKHGVKFAVQNFGEVISEEDLPHLFERFYRADKVRSVGGYGLGLSIAKNIAEALGGSITAQSDEKNGTVFTVTL